MPFNRNLPRIDASRFSMVPRADIPRSTFVTTHGYKTTFHTGYLIPFHLDEVLPGDVHQGQVTIFARLATPLFPIMDNIQLESFFFFVPCRLLWTNWKKMMGERASPADSISYTTPQQVSPTGGYAVASLQDYLGLPTTPMLGGNTVGHNALPLRAYNLIWNEWFRDQNLQNSLTVDTGDGPDTITNYVLKKRNKRHDYFTSALPWPLKGGVEVTIPMLGSAAVKGIGILTGSSAAVAAAGGVAETDATADMAGFRWTPAQMGTVLYVKSEIAGAAAFTTNTPQIYADLSTATGQTINALRLAFQTQRLLERDARSGTRYTELLRAHFGVTPEDSRLQRPEYIGGGRTNLSTQAIPQTSATGLTGGTTPLGGLGAAATANDQHSFSYHATEHGYIIGLINATGEITYQQGEHRLWRRTTRYDFYWPVFAHLGEQSIYNRELYVTGTDVNDNATFGYQERWADYRHRPSRITAMFKSTTASNIDEWHLAQLFSSLPTLNSTFIEQDTSTFERVLAAGPSANNQQILFDSVFKIRTTRAMPMFSVPGMIDHF